MTQARTSASSDAVAIQLRDYRPGDEAHLVELLSEAHRTPWGSEEYWRWKHLRRPGFREDDIIVATHDGKAAACFHGAVLPLVVDEGLEVPMCVEGDFAVRPAYRKLGIPDEAHDIMSRRLLARGGVLRGGFTSRELNERFYHKRFGYIFVPNVAVEYRKILGLDSLAQRVEKYGSKLLTWPIVRESLTSQPCSINVELEKFPLCHIRATADRVVLVEGRSSEAAVTIISPYQLLTALIDSRWVLCQKVVRYGVTGRFRIRGLLRVLPTIVRAVTNALRRRQ
jgi:GNAT superfamily N-acetyltransferase